MKNNPFQIPTPFHCHKKVNPSTLLLKSGGSLLLKSGGSLLLKSS